MKSAAVLTLLAASACIPSRGPMMDPHRDCLGCHGGGEAKRWTAAGTWTEGARVTVIDANGKNVPMDGNQAGNFYTAEGLALPFTVSVNGETMPDPAVTAEPRPAARLSYGGCNACHLGPGQVIELGPEMLPGSDCLTCHGAGGMASTRFSAAGTFPPPEWQPGTSVSVGGVSTTTNSVGNFFIEAPIAFPARATVRGSTMNPDPSYGGCNRCHVNGKADD
ncbi:MAG TPA: hypothetical protein VFL83_10435 [Anaeromyxobacter sp.]|nr:hypothetical protein [Anaeromyxobacter sp.]